MTGSSVGTPPPARAKCWSMRWADFRRRDPHRGPVPVSTTRASGPSRSRDGDATTARSAPLRRAVRPAPPSAQERRGVGSASRALRGLRRTLDTPPPPRQRAAAGGAGDGWEDLPTPVGWALAPVGLPAQDLATSTGLDLALRVHPGTAVDVAPVLAAPDRVTAEAADVRRGRRTLAHQRCWPAAGARTSPRYSISRPQSQSGTP